MLPGGFLFTAIQIMYDTPRKEKGQTLFYHLAFAVLIIFLAIFKFPDLGLPYFWDEINVYGLAAHYQYQHGLSLMPSSVPPDIIRGHPLLFIFMNASVMKILGDNAFVAHCFCFFISISLLLAIYSKIKNYFNPLTGLLSAILLAVQPIFLAQSGLILPEITLTLFIFLSLVSYYEERFLAFAIFASLAVLTKESALVLPIVVLAYNIFRKLLIKDNRDGLDLVNFYITLIPFVIFGIFLVVQRKENGWYFFPGHVNFININPLVFGQQLVLFLKIIVYKQQRYWMLLFVCASLLVALKKHQLRRENIANGFIFLLLIFCIAFLSFYSINNFLFDRYVIAVIAMFSIITAVCITSLSSNKILVTAYTLFFACIGWHNRELSSYEPGYPTWQNRFDGDSDLGYRYKVKMLQLAVNYVEQQSDSGEYAYGNFPALYALTFPEAGYISPKSHLKTGMKKDNTLPDYGLMDISPVYETDEPDPGPDTMKYRITLLKDFKEKNGEVKVFQLKLKKDDVEKM